MCTISGPSSQLSEGGLRPQAGADWQRTSFLRKGDRNRTSGLRLRGGGFGNVSGSGSSPLGFRDRVSGCELAGLHLHVSDMKGKV